MARAISIGFRAVAWVGAVLVVALGSLLVPIACRARSSPPPTTQPAPVRLTIGYGGPVESQIAGLRALASIIANERLLTFGRDGRVRPALAERWDVSPDGLTWRVTLRPTLTFHDGAPISAAIVANRIRACTNGPVCQDIVSVQPEGARTIVITLRRPSGLLPETLTYIMISGAAGVQAGPFRRPPNSKGTTFDVFPAYHRGRPRIDHVELKAFPTARSAWAALMRGEIDMLYEVAPEALDFIEQSSDTQVRSFLKPYAYTMVFNLRHPTLAQRDVRHALNLAVNRTDIIQRVFRGRGYPATDHLWPRHWAYHHELPRLRYEPAKAIQLLEGRGLRMPDVARADTRDRASSITPSRFRFTCLIPEREWRFERIGLMLQRQLVEVGVDMQIEAVPVSDLIERMRAGRFDAFLVDLASSSGLTYLYQLWHSPSDGLGTVLNSGYTGADAAFERLRAAGTDEETRAAVLDYQRAMRTDPPAVFLFWSETARAVSARFRVPLTPDRDIFSTLPQWQLASSPAAAP